MPFNIFPGVRLPFLRKGQRRPSALYAEDFNKHVAALNALLNPKVVFGNTHAFFLSNDGLTLQIGNAGDSGSSVSVQLFRFKSMSGDYITCRSWDGVTEGAVDINIAKPFKLRNSITSEVLRGVVVNYTGYDNTLTGQKRTASESGGTAVETQFITPPYYTNDLIWAVTANTLVSSVSLLDLNIDGRAWATYD